MKIVEDHDPYVVIESRCTLFEGTQKEFETFRSRPRLRKSIFIIDDIPK